MTDTVENIPIMMDMGEDQDGIEIGVGRIVGASLIVNFAEGVADLFVDGIRAGIVEGMSIAPVNIVAVAQITTLSPEEVDQFNFLTDIEAAERQMTIDENEIVADLNEEN